LVRAVENLKQLDNILNHYLPSGLTQAVEQIINLKNQEEAITTVERQLAAAAPPEAKRLADAVKYAQAELAQAKATYETGRRHCEEIAAAIEKNKIIAVQRAKHRPKK